MLQGPEALILMPHDTFIPHSLRDIAETPDPPDNPTVKPLGFGVSL
jgi:hypothetical protein